SSGPCCDRCRCTKSEPPQCQCQDVRLNSCHSACEACVCSHSMPGLCSCLDITHFCHEPCKSSGDDED
uniref:Bowman-Birk type proteinase inhibitor 1 n=1 Tax=Macropsychanthus glaber TaxID=124593 RepID=IBB1_MACGL|nr:RecName: Full=Bowman-Birk type proteinase inhibitor 1; AltName: Full=Bowman-Birk type proteinase inhibitor I; AltName: Full=DgTI [Macropsychanthus glabrus]